MMKKDRKSQLYLKGHVKNEYAFALNAIDIY
jgi:hypothetical protein